MGRERRGSRFLYMRAKQYICMYTQTSDSVSGHFTSLVLNTLNTRFAYRPMGL